MNKQEAVALLHQEVKTAATTIGREWADVIDSDDAEQEIWLRLLGAGTNPETGIEYVVEVAGWDIKVRTSVLKEIGHQIGMQYRDDYELFSGNYVYGTREVRDMLDRGVLDSENGDYGVPDVPIWEMPESVIEQISRTDTDTATERIDLFLGLKRLARRNSSYFIAIHNRYVLDLPIDNSTSTESNRLTRAVDSLAREMNGAHRKRVAEHIEGPGTRTVLTNVQAQKLTRSDYTR
jgi:hypothetical protein